jgi:serine/threonine protein kinase
MVDDQYFWNRGRTVVLNPGERFAGYTIESVLGTGGMGAVYLAKHPRLPRRDALKLLNPAFSNDPNFRTRFEREADLAAGLVHRNIVAVYDRGSVDGQLWISMQYVAGVDASVAARAGDGSMTPHRVVHIISEVGAGLDYAHRAGLLHRDVKPANILLAAADDPSEPEHVLLTDFGIAKSTTDEVQHLTGTGNLLATLAYASPEQIEARKLDHRVDIYALGCVLFELLTGSVPYPESSPFATMTAHLKNPIPKVTEKVPWLPPGMDAVVAKAMAKNPDDRYNSCRELSLAARAALVAADPALSSPTRAETAVPVEHRPVGPDQTSMDVAVSAAAAAAEAAVKDRSLTKPRPPYSIGVRRTSPAQRTIAELGPISTSALPATDRIEAERLLGEAMWTGQNEGKGSFFDLPPRLPLLEVVPGDVEQEITVANSETTRSVAYARDGARHPKGLDDLIALLERHAGWQTRPLNTGPQYRPGGWTPTGSVPPLGGNAVRPTEINPYAAAGFQHTGPTGVMPPGGAYQSGPHPGYQAGPGFQTGPTQLTGPTRVPPKQGGAKKWILIGLAAVLVIAAGVTAAVFLTRTPDAVIAAPANFTAKADDKRNITVSWSPTTGATGYTVTRNGETMYTGVNTSWVDDRVLPGKYNYSVTATNAAGQTSPAAGPAPVTVADQGWTNLTNVAADFEGLIPSSPSEKGYAGATCTSASDNFGSNADGIINCTDGQGVVFWVMHFPSTATLDTYVKDNFGTSPEVITWTRDDQDAGTRYGSGDDEKALAYLLTTFDDAQFQDYVVYAEWKDHTTQELIDSWWKPAPF